MFFELRQYNIKSGKREDWIQLMEEEILPFQLSKGMVVVGSFVSEKPEEDGDLYVWIRRFESEDQRENLYRLVYGKIILDHALGNLLIEKTLVLHAFCRLQSLLFARE